MLSASHAGVVLLISCLHGKKKKSSFFCQVIILFFFQFVTRCCFNILMLQDNVNPYLELTLTTRKKISSVVKHLDNKHWRSSNLASGKLMLFPNNVCLDNLADSRNCTLEDSNLAAADIHASPSISLYKGYALRSQRSSFIPICFSHNGIYQYGN